MVLILSGSGSPTETGLASDLGTIHDIVHGLKRMDLRNHGNVGHGSGSGTNTQGGPSTRP